MLPAIAMIIAIYGSARLINDGLKRHPGHIGATALTWVASALASFVILYLAFAIQLQAAKVPTLAP